MTEPAPNDAVRLRRRRRRLALAAIVTLIAVAALLTPELTGGRTGDPRLTTYSTEPQGARLVYELAGRLGWHVTRWTDGPNVEADGQTVVAVLDPVQPIGALEAHRLLEHVRSGGALLYVMSGSSPLNDSLHLKRGFVGGLYEATVAGTVEAPRRAIPADSLRARRFGTAPGTLGSEEAAESETECTHVPQGGGGLPMWGDQTVRLWRFSWTRPRPAGTVIFARSTTEGATTDSATARSAPAAAGFPLGAGRVVVLSDPDLLRNDVLRVCKWGLDVVAVRTLEYLAVGAPARNRLVFDEYHQGFGTHPGTLRAIVVYLARSSSGHVLLQGMLAGLVLLLALGPRPLPPHEIERVERRSPLEHVGALAQAYARVGATRTATARLLRGVRRRVERDGSGGPSTMQSAEESNARFLEVAELAPERATDIAVIRHALKTPVTRREFEGVGDALKRLEQSLLAERR